MNLGVYLIDDGEENYFIASDEDDAMKLYLEAYSGLKADEIGDLSDPALKANPTLPDDWWLNEVSRMDDDEDLSVIPDEDNSVAVVKKCREWAAQEQRGFLASSVY